MEIYQVKVLHTNFLRGWGGQSNRILTEAAGVSEKGWEILISAPPESKLIEKAREAEIEVDVTVRYVGGLRAGVIADTLAMRRLIRRFDPDIVHLHGGRDSWVYAYAAATLPTASRPVVIRSKHNIFPVAGHPLNRWQYGKLFDSIVCISTAIERDLAETGFIDPSKLVTIPSAINAELYQAVPDARAEVRRELGYNDNDIVIGITGRLRREKAHDVLFRAVPLVVARCPRARFVCFGSGSLGGDLAGILQKSGMADLVKMAGFRKDVPKCLAALDIYTQPSRSEGLGTSVLEAGAAGLPVVASNSGGIPDIIRHEETGLLTPVENHEALANELIRLIEDAPLRERLGAAARQRVEQLFSVETLIESTDAHYRRMITDRPKLL